MHLSLKKKIAAAALAATVVAGGGLAFAYFTTTGAGTGSATVGTSTALVLTGTTTGTLYPGTSVPVSFNAANSSTGNQFVGTITLASVTTDKAGCVVADFTMPPVVANQQVAPGPTNAISAGGTLTLANTAVSQDACKNAAVTLNLTSS
ncbi:MAG: hypothetical protein ACRDZW_02725 [Acidimicrobiales bacterium]